MTFTTDIVSKGDAILNQDFRVKGPLTVWQEFVAFLDGINQVYVLDEAHTDLYPCATWAIVKAPCWSVFAAVALQLG